MPRRAPVYAAERQFERCVVGPRIGSSRPCSAARSLESQLVTLWHYEGGSIKTLTRLEAVRPESRAHLLLDEASCLVAALLIRVAIDPVRQANASTLEALVGGRRRPQCRADQPAGCQLGHAHRLSQLLQHLHDARRLAFEARPLVGAVAAAGHAPRARAQQLVSHQHGLVSPRNLSVTGKV